VASQVLSESRRAEQEVNMVVMAAVVGVAVVFVGLALVSAAFNLIGRRDESRSGHYQ
jgi:hypothetical protein